MFSLDLKLVNVNAGLANVIVFHHSYDKHIIVLVPKKPRLP
mgnify:FL=1